MRIKVKRRFFKADYTIGSLFINGHWVCDTMEPRCIDWSKEKKDPGKTAIPFGKYQLQLRFSKKFGKLMPYLENVPHFEGIMIHTGNFPKHTEGCILVGYNTVRGLVLKSRDAFNKIMEKIDYARKTKQKIEVEVA